MAVLRRRQDVAHVADAGERHLQRPGNRRGGEGQHVDAHFQSLDTVLGLDAEPMFLVYHQQAQPAELDPVR